MEENKKVIVITGGNGFIGSHLSKRLHDEKRYVRVIDKSDDPTFRQFKDVQEFCSEFIIGDLLDPDFVREAMKNTYQVFHLAANMGGMGVIHPGNNFTIYRENHSITLNVLEAAVEEKVERFYFASSACVYPITRQSDHHEKDLHLKESDTWNENPHPQELYGTEKLCAETLVSQFSDGQMQIQIARFHNIYGEGSVWYGGHEKAPAAILRKAICATLYEKNPTIELWGTGEQRRSFLYIDDCLDAIMQHVNNGFMGPLNIGSEEAVSMTELAHIAFETVGVMPDQVKINYDTTKPVGVQNRNSDNTLIKKVLGWSPKVTIREGIHRTGKWIQEEMAKHFAKVDPKQYHCLFDEYKHSVVKDLSEDNIIFGILLPITSRGLSSPSDCIENLGRFAKSLQKTTKLNKSGLFGKKYRFKIYIGIDESDTFFFPIENNQAELTLRKHGVTDIVTKVFNYPPGSICAIWRDLARAAYEDGSHYIVLFGDDVELKTWEWMAAIDNAFSQLASEKKVPHGFGCIAFADISFPGFPAFPVLGRTHFDIFDKEIFPRDFINQDGDPYLFQLYRRWGCSVMLQDVQLTNGVGGPRAPRYTKQHHAEWSFEILNTGIAKIQAWLDKNSMSGYIPKPLLTLDVVVPSYRVRLEYLERMIKLRRSIACSTMIIIIIDDPKSQNIELLKSRYEWDPFIRIRVNDKNLGASETRNQGLKESSADYILFLDDDVIPDPDILIESEKIIKKHPKACGFVGRSKLPNPENKISTSAVVMSGVTFFWEICDIIESDVPWGITANLLIRRYKDDVWFDPRFPKTGGGEDIDFCLRKSDFFKTNVPGGEGFWAAPAVKVTHPWWNNGERSYRHFIEWSKGDGALGKMHLHLTYMDVAPDSAETFLGLVIILVGTFLVSIIIDSIIIRQFLKLSLMAFPSWIMAQVFCDLYRHMLQKPREFVQEINGYRRFLAAIESTVIRIASEWGRLEGKLRRKEWCHIGRRFDWFTGRWGEVSKTAERRSSATRFLVLIGLVVSMGSFIFA